MEYFLKWKGYPDSENTYSLEDDVFCDDLVREYWRSAVQQEGGLEGPPRGSKAYDLVRTGPSGPSGSGGGSGSGVKSPEGGEKRKRGLVDTSAISSSAAGKKKSPKKRSSEPSSASASSSSGDKSAKNDDTGDGSYTSPDFASMQAQGKSWETEVVNVETIARTDEALYVFVHMLDGSRMRVLAKQAYELFPKKMCLFFERHIKFKPASK